jgi:ADP-dependent glucokinase
MKLIAVIGIVVAAVLLGPMFFPAVEVEEANSKEAVLFAAMKELVSTDPERASCLYKSVAVGYNTNTDLVTSAVAVVKALGYEKPIEIGKPSDSISSLSDFVSLIGYFMREGSAVERVIVDYDLCKTIVDTSRQGVAVEHIGGNAALIASRMADSTKVVLAGNLPNSLKNQLHSNIRLLEGAEAPNPTEAHLILEYKKGETWGDIVAPRANRVIVHCDRTNAELKVVPSFHESVNSQSDLIVISGLHLLDQDNMETQSSQIEKILEAIAPSSLSPSVPVHLELASAGNLDYIELLGRTMIPNVNSIGLNEQELGFLFYSLTHSSSPSRASEAADYVRAHFQDPTIEQAIEALQHVLQLPSTNPSIRCLDRIHFHSLKFHIIASRVSGKWEDSALAVVSGSLAASLNACGAPSLAQLAATQLDLLLQSKDFMHSPVKTITRNGLQFSVSPVLVCRSPIRTVGLGDAISAAGLLHHAFSPSA